MNPIPVSQLVGLFIIAAIGLLLLVLSIVLLKGKGAWMIAGYNTSSAEEKAQYDQPALCRFVGKILLPLALLTFVMPAALVLDWGWFTPLYLVLTVGLCVFAVIYCNTGNHFKK